MGNMGGGGGVGWVTHRHSAAVQYFIYAATSQWSQHGF